VIRRSARLPGVGTVSPEVIPHARSAPPARALASWRDGPTRRAVVDLVARTADEVPADQRVAVL
jgi:hypothetical protein